MKKLSQLA